MRWELGSVPFLDDDIKAGLAGDIDEWDRQAKTVFGLSHDQAGEPELGYTRDTVSQAPERNVRPWRYPDLAVHLQANEGLGDPWPTLRADSHRDVSHSRSPNLREGGSRPRRVPSILPIQPTFRYSATQSEQAGDNEDAGLGDSLRRIRGLRQIMRQPLSDTARTWTGPSGPPSAGSGTGANAVELPLLDEEESESTVAERSTRRRRRRSSSTNEASTHALRPGIGEGGRAIRQRVGSQSASDAWGSSVNISQLEAPVGR
jgi:hypothetical protein